MFILCVFFPFGDVQRCQTKPFMYCWMGMIDTSDIVLAEP